MVPVAQAAAQAGLSVGHEPRPEGEVLGYYALGLEQGRLDQDYFPLERARTRELLLRHLKAAVITANLNPAVAGDKALDLNPESNL